MFFKAADPDHATEVHIGPITLTLQQLYISVVSTCIVFPPSLTIVTIFKKVCAPSHSLPDWISGCDTTSVFSKNRQDNFYFVVVLKFAGFLPFVLIFCVVSRVSTACNV